MSANSVVRHFKGGLYRVLREVVSQTPTTSAAGAMHLLFVAHDVEDDCRREVFMRPVLRVPDPYIDICCSAQGETVLYLSMESGALYLRPRAQFYENVRWPDGIQRPRFCPIDRINDFK